MRLDIGIFAQEAEALWNFNNFSAASFVPTHNLSVMHCKNLGEKLAHFMTCVMKHNNLSLLIIIFTENGSKNILPHEVVLPWKERANFMVENSHLLRGKKWEDEKESYFKVYLLI